LFSLTELKILEMRATRMRLLPVTLPKLTKLERLDLGANSFIEFVSFHFSPSNKNLLFFLACCFNKSPISSRIMA
jgi:hypothetical protein